VIIGIPGQACVSLPAAIGLFHEIDLDPFGGAKPRFLRRGKEAPLRVNPEQAQAFRLGSRRVDMIGIGPYSPHPELPLSRGESRRTISEEGQVANTDTMIPSKACIREGPSDCHCCLHHRIHSVGKKVGTGQSGRIRRGLRSFDSGMGENLIDLIGKNRNYKLGGTQKIG